MTCKFSVEQSAAFGEQKTTVSMIAMTAIIRWTQPLFCRPIIVKFSPNVASRGRMNQGQDASVSFADGGEVKWRFSTNAVVALLLCLSRP
jgi:hypothetical protein